MNALYELNGVVIEGQKRGRKFGYPTANIKLESNIPEGIYSAKVRFDNSEYLAAAFVGNAKTFNETNYQLEVYILDFSQQIYGKKLYIKLYNKLRENKKFSTVKDLITQINTDVQRVREYFLKQVL